MGRWSDSVALTKTSFRMIREDRALLWIPLVAGLCLIGIVALFLVPVLAWVLLTPNLSGFAGMDWLWFVIGVGLYLSLTFVGTYFYAALIGAATIKLNGGSPTIADGLAVARQHWKAILLWSLLAVTVGLIIQAVSSRFGALTGLILRVAAGVTWAIATYFVVPVILYENLGTFGSLKRSAGLFVQTFGRTVFSNLLLALIGFGIAVVGIVLLFAGIFTAFGGSVALGLVLVVLGFVVFVFDALLMTAVGGVMRAALYRYATTGQILPGFLPAAYQGGGSPPPPPVSQYTAPPLPGGR